MIAKEARALLEAMRFALGRDADGIYISAAGDDRCGLALRAWLDVECRIADAPETEPAPTELQQAEEWATAEGYARAKQNGWWNESSGAWLVFPRLRAGSDLTEWGYEANDDKDVWGFHTSAAALIAAWKARPEAKREPLLRAECAAPRVPHDDDTTAQVRTLTDLYNRLHDRVAELEAKVAP